MEAAARKTRVLICDDSAYMRKVLQTIVSTDPQLEVAGEARDGRDAVTQAELLHPDVITMDINMPGMDGLQATEAIMASNPRPILIVSSESREGADITLKALELGAIDFVAKPSSGVDLDLNTVRDDICRKLKVASKVRVVRTASRSRIGHEIANSGPRTEPNVAPGPARPAPRPPLPTRVPENGQRFPVVVLAASTGGPATLMKMMPGFAGNFPGAVILVQHMPGSFSSQFCQQLAEVCPLRVKEAESGEILAAGTVYVCPGAKHTKVSQTGRLILTEGERIDGYIPSANLVMETTAEYAGAMTIGVVLTGMGNDGVRGAQAIREAGGFVVAQDEQTSIIFGMNAEVIRASAADVVVPVENLVSAIERRVLFLFGASRVGAL